FPRLIEAEQGNGLLPVDQSQGLPGRDFAFEPVALGSHDFPAHSAPRSSSSRRYARPLPQIHYGQTKRDCAIESVVSALDPSLVSSSGLLGFRFARRRNRLLAAFSPL